MGFRFQKRINLGGGLRLNLSKSTIGISGGVRGARVSINSKGRQTTSVGIPGTGLYYRTDRKVGGAATRGGRGSQGMDYQPPRFWPPRIPLLAPKEDKDFLRGVRLYCNDDYTGALSAFQALPAGSGAPPGVDYFVACCLGALGRHDEAAGRWEALLQRLEKGGKSIPDQRMLRYRVSVPVMLFPNADPQQPVLLAQMSVRSAWLSLAQSYERAGKIGQAISALKLIVASGDSEQSMEVIDEALGVDDGFLHCLGWLARLQLDVGDLPGVVATTNGVRNEDNLTLQMLVWRGSALFNSQQFNAAQKVSKDAQQYTRDRDRSLLQWAQYLDGRCYEAQGNVSMAIKVFERLAAQDSSFLDVIKRLTDLKGGGGASGQSAPPPPPPARPKAPQGAEMTVCIRCRRSKPLGRRCPHCGHRS